jgi:hypothetical protein
MRVNKTLTITAGTPQNLAVALGMVASAAALATANPILANRIDAQMGAGSTGWAYYMDLAALAPGTVASTANAAHVTQQLPVITASMPGLPFTDASAGIGYGGARDITRIWFDVSHTGDTVITSVDLRV